MLDGHHMMIGIDRSAPLAQIAASRAAHAGSVCIGDANYVPLRAGIFDAALSIAVLHHLSTRARRLAALRQLTRIVRPGGRILVYAWSLLQVMSLFVLSFFTLLILLPLRLPALSWTPGSGSSAMRVLLVLLCVVAGHVPSTMTPLAVPLAVPESGCSDNRALFLSSRSLLRYQVPSTMNPQLVALARFSPQSSLPTLPPQAHLDESLTCALHDTHTHTEHTHNIHRALNRASRLRRRMNLSPGRATSRPRVTRARHQKAKFEMAGSRR